MTARRAEGEVGRLSRARRAAECPREPIALALDEAATFVGVSATTFVKAVDQGAMPQGRRLFGRVLWDAEELRTAFRRLPRHGVSRQDADADVDWTLTSA